MSDQFWPGVDQRHMAALAAVAEHGSFRAAAESLGYVQSAVSDQISHLERAAGLPLVERRRGATGELTEAGRRLLRRFRSITAELAAARADLAALDGSGAASLRVGAPAALGGRLLSRPLVAFHAERPDVAVEVLECGSHEETARRLTAGEVDVALVILPLPGGSLRRRDLLSDPYVLLAPAAWPMARAAAPVTVTQLAGLPLVGAGEGPARELVEAELRAAGVEPHYVLRSELDGIAREAVAAGLGAAIVPRSATSEPDPRIVALELDPPLTPRVIALAWTADLPEVERFARLATSAQPATVTLSARELPLSNG